MDNIDNKTKAHSISMDNRKRINMTGIEKVIGSSDNIISLTTTYGGLTMTGKNLKITKYNVEDGIFAAEGDIESIKYSGVKTPLLKRMFK